MLNNANIENESPLESNISHCWQAGSYFQYAPADKIKNICKNKTPASNSKTKDLSNMHDWVSALKLFSGFVFLCMFVFGNIKKRNRKNFHLFSNDLCHNLTFKAFTVANVPQKLSANFKRTKKKPSKLHFKTSICRTFSKQTSNCGRFWALS